ncbi:MAG: NADH-quinone oxidoreductase subunit H [Oscillospiraceae bacterium]
MCWFSPGFLFCFLAGMLLCGIDRKLVAKMQKRVGPPILQPFYDFFKLCGKETIIPAAAERISFMLAPLLGLAALVVIQLFIPVFSFTAFYGMADIIVILYLLLIPAISIIMGGAASGSPYAGVGLSREMVTIISCELPLVLVLLAVAKTVGSAMGTGLCFSQRHSGVSGDKRQPYNKDKHASRCCGHAAGDTRRDRQPSL